MKTFVCKICGHVQFNEAPENCPVCHAVKEAFLENSDAIQKVGLPDRKEADNKHVPKIVIKKECGLIPGGCCTDVHVKVGEIEHPMQEKHYIQYIDFYLDYKYVSRITLSPLKCHPAAALHLNVTSGKITVIENCNLHGNWIGDADL